jgi:3',5'-cyclic AMP phosphodiesterase CpdA
LLIAQLSDLHVRPEGCLYHDVVDSNRMLGEAIAHLACLDRMPDLVLITGDLVDEGRVEEYDAAHKILEALAVPFLVIPGNHDRRANFRACFADHVYLPAIGPLHYCVDAYPVRIIALDSTVPGLHHGAIDNEGLSWLRVTLAANETKPTIVMLHHPPFVCGIPYMDDYRYLDPEPLAEVLGSFSNVELVLCGHVHRPMFRRWAGTVVAACPSTTTEIALRLAPDASPASFLGPPACMLHFWDDKHGMVSHISHIGQFEGPYAFA